MNIIEYAGKQLYQLQYLKEKKRYLTYRFRAWLHKKEMAEYLAFFEANPLRKQLPYGNPSFIEQVTRGFFYRNSTWSERINLVKRHIRIMEGLFNETFTTDIYINHKNIVLWQEMYKDSPLTLELVFWGGQRKEGTLSLCLHYNNQYLYQIMFWFGGTVSEPEIYIGAIQGILNGSEIIKDLTKYFYGYRTKNLIFFGLRCFASNLSCRSIYGVTNEGYYAMNHLRLDRKLKTDFKEFWTECEGTEAQDKRFYIMPVAEHRKSMEELKPSKRAQHRRRYEKLDLIIQQINEKMKTLLK